MQVVRWCHVHGAAVRNITLEAWWSDQLASGDGFFALLPNLRSLHLHRWPSHLFGQLSCMPYITGLQTLVLHFREALHLSTEALEPIGRLSALKTLSIITIGQKLPLPSSFSALNRLSNLHLQQDISDPAMGLEGCMKVVQHMTGLQRLDLRQQTNEVPSAFTKLTALTSLSLQLFDYKAPSFGSLDSLLSCPLSYLQLWDLPEACYSDLGAILRSLTKLPNLLSLDLSYHEFEAIRPDVWTFGQHITSLHLKFCGLQHIPPALVAMTSLVGLDIRGNQPTQLPPGPYLLGLEHLSMDILFKVAPPTALLGAKCLRKLNLEEPADPDGRWDLDALSSQLAAKVPACVVTCENIPLASWLDVRWPWKSMCEDALDDASYQLSKHSLPCLLSRHFMLIYAAWFLAPGLQPFSNAAWQVPKQHSINVVRGCQWRPWRRCMKQAFS